MLAYSLLQQELIANPRRWLITGVAGFIGSHLLAKLLRLDQHVIGLDDFSSGCPANLEAVRSEVSAEQWSRFRLHQGSVADSAICRDACHGVDYVLHHAGFVSVPLSIENPASCHQTNVTGTLRLLTAARDSGVRRFVYASSSAVYGDDPLARKIESQLGQPLSPYGASKLMSELYANLFVRHFGLESIGLRYFNVFGPRQNPEGGYAAVIPRWTAIQVSGGQCLIHGDGSATRDYCHVANVVQANLLAATTGNQEAIGQVYNVALGGCTDLNALHAMIAAQLTTITALPARTAAYGPARNGDILHSSADITKITRDLLFAPAVTVEEGLQETVRWYAAQAGVPR